MRRDQAYSEILKAGDLAKELLAELKGISKKRYHPGRWSDFDQKRLNELFSAFENMGIDDAIIFAAFEE